MNDALREQIAKAIWEQEIAEDARHARLNRKVPTTNPAPWPEDSLKQPYCQSTYRKADAVIKALAAPAAPSETEKLPDCRQLAELIEQKVYDCRNWERWNIRVEIKKVLEAALQAEQNGEGDAVSEVEAIIKTLFHVCSCPSLAFGLPPHPHGWSPTGSNQTHGCPTCFLCRITAALAADREKQSPDDEQVLKYLSERGFAILSMGTVKELLRQSEHALETYEANRRRESSCGPRLAMRDPNVDAIEEDAGRQPVNKLSSSAQELQQYALLRCELHKALEAKHRAIDPADMTSIMDYFIEWNRARESQIRRDALNEAANYIEEWRECDCGAPAKKYNTENGHAINCDWYISGAIRALAQKESQP